jgi:hydrogenase-4 component E
MLDSHVITASNIVNVLGAAILLTGFATLAARQVYAAINAYALQSTLLAAVAGVVAHATGFNDVYIVAGLTILSKTVLITYFLHVVARRVEAWRELSVYVNIPGSLIIGAILTIIAYFATLSLPVYGALATKPSLAIAIAMMLIGLFVMISRVEAVMQIVGLVVLENGLFLGALAVSYSTPLIIEFGIFFDILIGVIVMAILVSRIRRGLETTATTELTRLRG